MKKIFYILLIALSISSGLMANQPNIQTVLKDQEAQTVANKLMYKMGYQDGYYGRCKVGSGEFYLKGYSDGYATAISEEEARKKSDKNFLIGVLGSIAAGLAVALICAHR